jgi:ABC-type nitrate/sulfonate/bicarbonate transport system substrate-binding protein
MVGEPSTGEVENPWRSLVSTIRRKAVALAGTVGVFAAALVGVTATPAAAAETNIKVGTVAINAMGQIPWAQSAGIFKKNGLNVTEIRIFPAPPPSLAALAAGAVDFVYSPSIPIINAYANGGMALKVVAPADGYKRSDLAAAKKDLALAAKLDDTGVCVSPTGGINSWKDLNGKTVAVPARNAQGEVTIAQAMVADGGNPGTVNWVTLPFPAMLDALKAGRVNAAFTVEPFTSACSAQGLKNLGSPGIQFFTIENAIGMWVTTADYAAKNPDAVLAFQKSIAEVHKFGNTPAGWDKILQSANPVYTQVDLATARKSNPSYFPPTITALDLRGPADKMLALGYLKKPLDIKGLLYKQYRG